MPYPLKLYIYVFSWFTAATVLADQWLRQFSVPFILTFAVAYATLMILFVAGCLGERICKG